MSAPWSQRLLDSPTRRLMLIGLLVLLLMIPASMIRDVVTEREARRDAAVADITAKWGGEQQLTGPILRVPYTRQVIAQDDKGKAITRRESGVGYFLPKRLAIRTELTTERRQRGLFEVPVYVAAMHLSGAFEKPDLASWGVAPEDIDWPRAELLIGLTEPRSLRADAALAWAGQPLALKPSTGQSGSWAAPGIHAALGPAAAESLATSDPAALTAFTLDLTLNGAQALHFAPTAEETTVQLVSDWPHPSFQGQWLPGQRDVVDGRDTAQWSVSHLGRNYPQRWRESSEIAETVQGTRFGMSLATPLDLYALADRSTKYALLTLVFTFAVIWLLEVLSGQRVHPIQYGFVGAALCLFGLLQLSFAEHFGFNAAFAVAASSVLVLVTVYSHGVLKSTTRALAVGGVLGGIYAYLFVILRAEDYALLGGSLALLAGLALAMFVTRRVDWFATDAVASSASGVATAIK